MKVLFFLCNNCTQLAHQSRIWIHDPVRCACIFLDTR